MIDMIELTETEILRRNKLIEDFDFEKLIKVFKLLNITWEIENGLTIEDLKELCKNLIDFTIKKSKRNKKDIERNLYGFKCTCYYKKINDFYNEKNYLKLEYILEEQDDTYFRLQNRILRKEKIENILKNK